MSTPSANHSELFEGRGWVVILRGLSAMAFGVLAVAWPDVSLRRLIVLFGIYALLHGSLSLAAAAGHRGQQGCLLLATEGIVSLVAGVLTLKTRSPSPMAFAFVVWLWAIIAGILRVAEAIRLRKSLKGDVWLLLSGAVTALFGGMLVVRPIIGSVGVAFLIAAAALIWGLFEVLLGWEIRRFGQ